LLRWLILFIIYSPVIVVFIFELIIALVVRTIALLGLFFFEFGLGMTVMLLNYKLMRAVGRIVLFFDFSFFVELLGVHLLLPVNVFD
jgi:hypothetical protein